MNKPELFNEDFRATYCPEDDKLRLYVGRVPRDEYLALKAEGWTNTPKQSEAGQGEFAATWTPSRRDTAISYAGIIEDEDAGPEERAADRAERFGGYRDKRESEAIGHADRYDAGPQAFGYQSKARAVRAADRHDRIAGRAVDAWEKAEYWTRRTAGVIHHALYKSTPAVRMGRIKTLEAAQRKHEASREAHRKIYEAWQKVAEMEGADVLLPLDGGEMNPAQRLAYNTANTGGYHMSLFHPDGGEIDENGKRVQGSYFHGFSPYDFLTHDTYGGGVFRRLTPKEYALHFLANATHPDAYGMDWKTHYELRLAYEHQMLEAQGGRAAFVEMEAGGFVGDRQITKVTKSPATGRVVSVEVEFMSAVNQWGNPWPDGKGARLCKKLINVERMGANIYRPPTDEERAAYAAKVAEEKKAKGKAAKAKRDAGENCPLINPTDEDAQRLQDAWNEKAFDSAPSWAKEGARSKVVRLTQEECTRAGIKTTIICETGDEHKTSGWRNITRCDVFKIRTVYANGNGYSARRVVIITDKPQKPIPWAALERAKASCPSPESVRPHLLELAEEVQRGDDKHSQLAKDAAYIGWINDSLSRISWTDRGLKALSEFRAEPANA